MITVVNKRNSQHVAGAVVVYIGRPSALGNPFVIGADGSRSEVIAKYELWLMKQLDQHDSAARQAFERLVELSKHHDVQLQCWCSPAACHGDVLKEMIELKREEV